MTPAYVVCHGLSAWDGKLLGALLQRVTSAGAQVFVGGLERILEALDGPVPAPSRAAGLSRVGRHVRPDAVPAKVEALHSKAKRLVARAGWPNPRRTGSRWLRA
jgi:hypothetical protein